LQEAVPLISPQQTFQRVIPSFATTMLRAFDCEKSCSSAVAVAGDANIAGDRPSCAHHRQHNRTLHGRSMIRTKSNKKHHPIKEGTGQDIDCICARHSPKPVTTLQPCHTHCNQDAVIENTTHSLELVKRKVTALLNKLTTTNFDSISNQLVACVNGSQGEKPPHTLVQASRLILDQAKASSSLVNHTEMYARLCHKMMGSMSPDIIDEGVRDKEGNPTVGGELLRKYLLHRCQEDFERRWPADDQPLHSSVPRQMHVEPFSKEDYAAAKEKRQGLGLIKFLCELFKLKMANERVMHECVKRLLDSENPEGSEERLEPLCVLLATVGHLMDTPRAQGHMVLYFARMESLRRNDRFPQRIRFILQVSCKSAFCADSQADSFMLGCYRYACAQMASNCSHTTHYYHRSA
jgi:MIF4G domain